MNEGFDIVSLVFLVVAVVVFLRLRNALGRDTKGQTSRVGMVERWHALHKKVEKQQKMLKEPAKMDGFTTELADVLRKITRKTDGSFDHGEFLSSAKDVYKTIVLAYADGDVNSLKKFLTPQLFSSFNKIIEQRKSRHEVSRARVQKIENAQIIEATLVEQRASITVKFVANLLMFVRDGEGKLVEGDSEKSQAMTDIWTFEKDLQSKDATWYLCGTEVASQAS